MSAPHRSVIDLRDPAPRSGHRPKSLTGPIRGSCDHSVMSAEKLTQETIVEELMRLGATDVRIDGSSVRGTFSKAGSDGKDAHVWVNRQDPWPAPEPIGDGRVRYRFARLGTWGGYVDVVADR